jgi:hypothetical protein
MRFAEVLTYYESRIRLQASGGESWSVLPCYFRFSPWAGVRRRPRVPVSSRPRLA